MLNKVNYIPIIGTSVPYGIYGREQTNGYTSVNVMCMQCFYDKNYIANEKLYKTIEKIILNKLVIQSKWKYLQWKLSSANGNLHNTNENNININHTNQIYTKHPKNQVIQMKNYNI